MKEKFKWDAVLAINKEKAYWMKTNKKEVQSVASK